MIVMCIIPVYLLLYQISRCSILLEQAVRSLSHYVITEALRRTELVHAINGRAKFDRYVLTFSVPGSYRQATSRSTATRNPWSFTWPALPTGFTTSTSTSSWKTSMVRRKREKYTESWLTFYRHRGLQNEPRIRTNHTARGLSAEAILAYDARFVPQHFFCALENTSICSPFVTLAPAHIP